MKITFESKAWISEYNSNTPEQLRTPKGADSLYYTSHDMSKTRHTFAGNATITLDLCGERELVDNKVASLREQAVSIRAKATAEVTRIEGQIQQLLCIENSTVSLASVLVDDDGIPF
jgi:hypothetical protein